MNPDIRKQYVEFLNIELKNKSTKKTKVQEFSSNKYDMFLQYRKIQTKKPYCYLNLKLEEYLKEVEITNEMSNENKKMKVYQQNFEIFIAENFPLNLIDFMPILRIMARGNILMGNLLKFLEKKNVIFFNINI